MHASASVFAPKRVLLLQYGYGLVLTTSGIASGTKGAASFFTKTYDNTTAAAARTFLSGGGVSITTNATEFISVSLTDGSNTLSAVSTSFQILAANAENHVVVDWDVGFAAGLKRLKVFVDGTEIAMTITDASPSFTLPYLASQWSTQGDSTVALRELMLWLNTVPSFPTDLTKLRYSSGQPADVGETGQYLTVRPDAYLSLRGAASPKAFQTNRGKSSVVVTFYTYTPLNDRTRIMGYGDSNMAGAGNTPYTNKIGDLATPPIFPSNVGVTSATLPAINGYMVSGNTSTNPRRDAAVNNLAYVKANWPDAIIVLQGGGNSLPTVSGSGNTSADMLSQFATMVATLLSYLPDARFIVQGISTRTASPNGSWQGQVLAEVNAGLAATYGAKYFDVDAYLRSDQAFVDAAISKSAQDIIDLANGIVPDSFRSGDPQHLNQLAHNILTPRAFAKMQSLGYFK